MRYLAYMLWDRLVGYPCLIYRIHVRSGWPRMAAVKWALLSIFQ